MFLRCSVLHLVRQIAKSFLRISILLSSCFPFKTILRLHDSVVTHKIVKKVTTVLDFTPVVILKKFEHSVQVVILKWLFQHSIMMVI